MMIERTARLRRVAAIAAGALGVVVLAGCGLIGGDSDVTPTASTGTETPTPTVSAEGDAPTIINFAQVGPACDSNNQITLTWTLGGAATGATISIDGPGIYDTYPGTTATEKFPGACNGDTQTFLLTTVGGTPAATQTIVVQPAPTPTTAAPASKILTFVRQGPKCDSNNQVTLHWELTGGATGATISIDGPGIYNTYNGTNVTEQFPGACNGDTQVFLLTTIGGGAAEQKTLTVTP